MDADFDVGVLPGSKIAVYAGDRVAGFFGAALSMLGMLGVLVVLLGIELLAPDLQPTLSPPLAFSYLLWVCLLLCSVLMFQGTSVSFPFAMGFAAVLVLDRSSVASRSPVTLALYLVLLGLVVYAGCRLWGGVGPRVRLRRGGDDLYLSMIRALLVAGAISFAVPLVADEAARELVSRGWSPLLNQ